MTDTILIAKTCTICLCNKTLSEYPFDKRRNYHQTICKACKLQKEARWRDARNKGKAYLPKRGRTQNAQKKGKDILP